MYKERHNVSACNLGPRHSGITCSTLNTQHCAVVFQRQRQDAFPSIMSTMPSEAAESSRPPPRLPRLTYRTQLSDAESMDTVATDGSEASAIGLASPVHSDYRPSPRRAPSNACRPRSAQPSTASGSPFVPTAAANPTKKKSSFLGGFFSVKEPSAQALADYERQMMSQGSLREGKHRARAVGFSGISSAALPRSVPKVNSRWDGLPPTLKEREKRRYLGLRNSTSPSSPTTPGSERSVFPLEASDRVISQGRGQCRGTMSTAHSDERRNTMAAIYGWEVPQISDGGPEQDRSIDQFRPNIARATTSKSAPEPIISSSPRFNDLQLPIILPSFLEQPTSSLAGSILPPEYSDSPCLTPYDSLPPTPNAPPAPTNVTSSAPKMNPHDNIKTTIVVAPSSVDAVMIKSAGINILAPPEAAKRSCKAKT